MKQEDLKRENRYLYAKLRNMPFCAKCNRIINKDDEIEHMKTKGFRGRVQHKFYHARCVEWDSSQN